MAEVKTYQGADEPTDMAPGTTWLKDDGNAVIRKPDGTWNLIGQWTVPNMGMVDIQGDTMLGPLLGAHGLAPLDSPDFTGTVQVAGEEVATKTWTTEQLSDLQTTLEDFIGGQFSGSETTISIGNNLAIGYGNGANAIPHGGAIPLPKYGDGSRAQLSEVVGVVVSVSSMAMNDGAEANTYVWTVSVDANLTVTCKTVGTHWGEHDGSANYLIICKR